jgi:hypothetical protein
MAVALPAELAHATPQESASPAASVAPAPQPSPENRTSGGSYLDYFRDLVSRLHLPQPAGPVTEGAIAPLGKTSLEEEGIMSTDTKQKHEQSDNRSGDATKALEQRGAGAWNAIMKAWTTARERLGLRDQSQA